VGKNEESILQDGGTASSEADPAIPPRLFYPVFIFFLPLFYPRSHRHNAHPALNLCRIVVKTLRRFLPFVTLPASSGEPLIGVEIRGKPDVNRGSTPTSHKPHGIPALVVLRNPNRFDPFFFGGRSGFTGRVAPRHEEKLKQEKKKWRQNTRSRRTSVELGM